MYSTEVLRSRRTIVVGLLSALIVLVFPLLVGTYYVYLANVLLIYIIVVVGLGLLVGMAGQFSFAHVAFFGIGAYSSVLLTAKLGIPFWFSLPLGGLLAAGVGFVFGLPALRLRGLYLAIVSLAFAMLSQMSVLELRDLTGGAQGVGVPAPTLGSLRLAGDRPIYYLVLVSTVASCLIARNIMRSRTGRAFISIRDSEIAAQSAGVSLAKYKSLAFILSAVYAGFAGGLFAVAVSYISASVMSLDRMVLFFTMLVVGGLDSLWGAALGAVLLGIIPHALRDFQALTELIYGVLIIVFILFMPRGIFRQIEGLINRLLKS